MKPATAYLQSATRTADPRELVVMLYDGILRFLAEAEQHLANKLHGAATQSAGRAMDIVSELLFSLDHGPMPELSQQLESLYIYINERLLHISLRQDVMAIDEVRQLVGELRDGWADALRQLRHQDHQGVARVRSGHAVI